MEEYIEGTENNTNIHEYYYNEIKKKQTTFEPNSHWFKLVNRNKNFVIFNNEILMLKVNGKPVCANTIALYTRLMSLPNTWKINLNGLATLMGSTKAAATKALNELIELGYVCRINVKMGKNRTYIAPRYFIFETLKLRELFGKEEFLKQCYVGKRGEITIKEEDLDAYFQNNKKIFDLSRVDCFQLFDTWVVEIEDPASDNLYKTCNNKTCNSKTNSNKKRFKINNNFKSNVCFNSLNNSTKSKQFNFSKTTNNKIEHVNEQNNSHGLSMEKHVSMEQSDISLDKTRDNPRNDTVSFSWSTKPENLEDEEIKKEVKEDSIRTVDLQEFRKTMGDLNPEDNAMSNALRMAKELMALDKKVNQTNIKNYTKEKRVITYIEKTFANTPLCQPLINYVKMFGETFFPISKEALNAKIASLSKFVFDDQKLMADVIEESTKNSWKDFYVSDQIKVKIKPKTVREVIESTDTNEIALDKNGDPLIFG